MKIIALNLPRNIKNPDLEKLFARYGAVESCELVMDKVKKTSKGFGFVEMLNDDEANAAITKLHGTKFKGCKIRIKESVPNKQEE